MSEAAVELDGITKRYAQHVAVRSLSLRVPCGVVYGLLGPNGAGKTTTIRMVNDILRPDEGRIVLFGSLPPGRAALRRIGYLPEERGLHQKMTVGRVLAFLAALRGLSAAEATPRIARWLARLDLAEWIDRKVESLSKGMQQKVQFIATVLHEPDLLILDEPFSGLDPINADVLRDIMKEQKAAGRTIIFSTHLMEHAEQLCDEVCIIAHAEKVLEGPLADVKREAREARRAFVVETSPMPEAAPAALRPEAGTGVAAARREGDHFEIDLRADARPGDVLRRLLDEGLEVVRFERWAPTLHQIFVDRVRVSPATPPPRANPQTEAPAEEAAPHG